MEISFNYLKGYLFRNDNAILASNSVNLAYAKFNLDDTWKGYTVTAVFEKDQPGYHAYHMLLDGEKCCKIPSEVMGGGDITVSLIGEMTDQKQNILRITTNKVRVEVSCNACLEGENVTEPTPTQMEQALGYLSQAKEAAVTAANIAENLAAKAENGEFNGEKGYSPIKGIDYFTRAERTEMVKEVLSALPTTEGVGF